MLLLWTLQLLLLLCCFARAAMGTGADAAAVDTGADAAAEDTGADAAADAGAAEARL